MTPQEKAKELIDKFYYFTASFGDEQAKQCALISVELHLEELSKMKLIFSDRELHYKFWQQVKEELTK
jgi:hypothetical protein